MKIVALSGVTALGFILGLMTASHIFPNGSRQVSFFAEHRDWIRMRLSDVEEANTALKGAMQKNDPSVECVLVPRGEQSPALHFYRVEGYGRIDERVIEAAKIACREVFGKPPIVFDPFKNDSHRRTDKN